MDLDGAAIVVRATLERRKHGEFGFREPMTARGRRRIPIGAAGVEVLRRARTRQLRERLAAGRAWTDVDLVFTGPTGADSTPRRRSLHLYMRYGRRG